MEFEWFWSNLKYCTWQKSTSCPWTVNLDLDHDFRHGVMSKKPFWSLKRSSNLFTLLQFVISMPLLVDRGRRGQELVLLFTCEASLLIQNLYLKEVMYAHILTLPSIILHILSLISCNHIVINVHFLFWAGVIQEDNKIINVYFPNYQSMLCSEPTYSANLFLK